MDPHDISKHLEIFDAEMKDRLGRRALGFPTGELSLVARTTTMGSYPTSAQCYFACQPVVLTGTESEGGSGVSTLQNSVFLALNLGSSIPPIGTQVIVTYVQNRWVFRYDG